MSLRHKQISVEVGCMDGAVVSEAHCHFLPTLHIYILFSLVYGGFTPLNRMSHMFNGFMSCMCVVDLCLI